MKTRVPLTSAQHKLAAIWLIGAGTIFLVLLAQTVGGKYGHQTERAWAWFLPTVVPTLSVILSASAYAATKPAERRLVEERFYLLTVYLSVFYLVVVFSTLLLQPLSGDRPLDFINKSSLWLGPLQGLVGIGLGAFFTSTK